MYENTLSDFFETIQNHTWITHSHICIYMAIYELWHQNKFVNPVPVSRSKLMNMSKVSANCNLSQMHQGAGERKIYIIFPVLQSVFREPDIYPFASSLNFKAF